MGIGASHGTCSLGSNVEADNSKSLNEEILAQGDELLKSSRSLLARITEALNGVIDLRDGERSNSKDAEAPSAG